MGLLSYLVPELNKPDKTEDPKIANALTAILAWANGEVDASNFATAYKDGAINVACLRTLGTGAQQAAPGNTSLQTTVAGLKLQAGRTSLGVLPPAFSTGEIALPTPWGSQHIAFIASGRGVLNDAGFVLSGVDIDGLGHGVVVVNNNTEQEVIVNWLSIGF